MHRISRRSFVWAGVAVAAAFGVVRWIDTRPDAEGVVSPLRKVLRLNQKAWTAALSEDRLVPTYALDQVTPERENGDEGLGDDFDPADWTLSVEGTHGQKGAL